MPKALLLTNEGAEIVKVALIEHKKAIQQFAIDNEVEPSEFTIRTIDDAVSHIEHSSDKNVGELGFSMMASQLSTDELVDLTILKLPVGAILEKIDNGAIEKRYLELNPAPIDVDESDE